MTPFHDRLWSMSYSDLIGLYLRFAAMIANARGSYMVRRRHAEVREAMELRYERAGKRAAMAAVE